jgi:glycosyltransferase involved in cell wall biosynthesis
VCARDASIVFAVSQFLSAEIASTIGRRVDVVTPFVGDEFVPSGVEQSGSVLFVGRLLRKKGIEFLCEVASHLPSVSFEITDFISPWTAPTEEHRALRALVRQQENCTLVPSPPTRAALARLMASAGVVFVPSQWAEPFGLVSIEAQAVGSRVVVTARGGLPETVIDPGSFVVSADAPGDAAAALVKALSGGPPDPQVSHEVRTRFSLARSSACLERLLVKGAR